MTLTVTAMDDFSLDLSMSGVVPIRSPDPCCANTGDCIDGQPMATFEPIELDITGLAHVLLAQ